MRWIEVVALSALFAIGCGSPSDEKDPVVVINNGANNGGANNGGANNGANNGATETDEALTQGITAPQDAKDAAEGALALTVEAAVIASVEANGGEALVTTGTLTQSGQSFTYSASPADKLVVAWADGPPTELLIEQLDGNFDSETVDAFFGKDHVVLVQLTREGFADIQVGSALSGGDREAGIVGSLTVDGVSYEVDLREAGSTEAEVGTSGDYESETSMTGTITAPGLSLQAEESHTFRLVYFDNVVTNRTRSANTIWTYNGTQYALQNLFIRTATNNGYPDELDFWRVEGVVTRDGAVVGEVTYEVTELKIEIFVLLEDGERVLLDSFLRYQGTGGD